MKYSSSERPLLFHSGVKLYGKADAAACMSRAPDLHEPFNGQIFDGQQGVY